MDQPQTEAEFNKEKETDHKGQPVAPVGPPHHHSAKKHLKEYLQEGLMIFIAVMLGFFAEKVRENLSNKEKEHQYMTSYIRDLKDDSAKLNLAIQNNRYKSVMLDSLLMLSLKNLSEPDNRLRFYRYCKNFVGFYSEFKNNEATFLQLTNADGLRLIKKNHAADSIAKYAILLKDIYAAEKIYADAAGAAASASQEVLDYGMIYDSTYYKNGDFTNKFLPLLNNDTQKIKWLLNKIAFERLATDTYLAYLESLQPFQTGFIQFLENTYE